MTFSAVTLPESGTVAWSVQSVAGIVFTNSLMPSRYPPRHVTKFGTASRGRPKMELRRIKMSVGHDVRLAI